MRRLPPRALPAWPARSLTARFRQNGGGAGTWLSALLACAACACLVACGPGQPAAASRAWELRSGLVRGLGEVVTDGRGFTLYIYVPDHQGASVCSGVCATQWPPLVLPRGVSRPVAGPGLNPALLGTTRRADGVLQVTYDRWPLYLWQGDLAPGQATGQAEAMGLWYALSVSGTVDRLPLPSPTG